MSNQTISLNISLTEEFPCSYLDSQKERLLVLIDPQKNAKRFYPTLLENGFRRSGEDIYRPHCQNCQACQSLRIPVNNFKLSRSQKRLINKNKNFRVIINQTPREKYFSLYEQYINQVHPQGAMFPASLEQYETFIMSSWNKALFIEVYDQEKLISVSVTDQIISSKNRAWSAFYCFYDPNYQAYSLGKYAILTQLRLAKAHNIDWLYLGYYIASCKKMNYKTQFNPHQRFITEEWVDFNNVIKKAQ